MSRCLSVRLSLLTAVKPTTALFTLGADAHHEATPLKDFKDARSYKVVRVIDADTVLVALDGKETHVRLIGVDTPETG